MFKPTHNMTGTRIHGTWMAMKQRCNDSNQPRHADWGGRGITYDPRWESFDAFFDDMGNIPAGMTLERKDNSKGYSKENCTWATPSAQAYNRRLSTKNQSGLKGVHWCCTYQVWIASATWKGIQKQLYRGSDFFEACCARKSWEANFFPNGGV